MQHMRQLRQVLYAHAMNFQSAQLFGSLSQLLSHIHTLSLSLLLLSTLSFDRIKSTRALC